MKTRDLVPRVGTQDREERVVVRAVVAEREDPAVVLGIARCRALTRHEDRLAKDAPFAEIVLRGRLGKRVDLEQ